jgi:hypothetical protein
MRGDAQTDRHLINLTFPFKESRLKIAVIVILILYC